MHENQEDLMKHLCRYNALDYGSCLHMLDPYALSDPVEQSYIFRPLTKQGYLKSTKTAACPYSRKAARCSPI